MASVAERIVSNIVTTIGALTPFAAAGAGGAVRSSSTGDKFTKTPVAIVLALDETKDPSPYTAYSCTLSIEVHIADDPQVTTPTGWETRMDELVRLVEKALMTDPERGIGGDSGVDTRILRHTKYPVVNAEGDGIQNICAALQLEVSYRHLRTDPEVVI